jgi:hypothetical protein
MMREKFLVLMLAGLVAAPTNLYAEAQEIRLAKQFSMGYVQFNILDHMKLIEELRLPPGSATSRWSGRPSTAPT